MPSRRVARATTNGFLHPHRSTARRIVASRSTYENAPFVPRPRACPDGAYLRARLGGAGRGCRDPHHRALTAAPRQLLRPGESGTCPTSQHAFIYRAITVSGRPFQVVRLHCWFLTHRPYGLTGPTTPPCKHGGLGPCIVNTFIEANQYTSTFSSRINRHCNGIIQIFWTVRAYCCCGTH
jgi:hypothetical protein